MEKKIYKRARILENSIKFFIPKKHKKKSFIENIGLRLEGVSDIQTYDRVIVLLERLLPEILTSTGNVKASWLNLVRKSTEEHMIVFKAQSSFSRLIRNLPINSLSQSDWEFLFYNEIMWRTQNTTNLRRVFNLPIYYTLTPKSTSKIKPVGELEEYEIKMPFNANKFRLLYGKLGIKEVKSSTESSFSNRKMGQILNILPEGYYTSRKIPTFTKKDCFYLDEEILIHNNFEVENDK